MSIYALKNRNVNQEYNAVSSGKRQESAFLFVFRYTCIWQLFLEGETYIIVEQIGINSYHKRAFYE